MTPQMTAPSRKISRYAQYGEWAANVALVIFAAVTAYFFYLLVTGPTEPNQNFELDLDIKEHFLALSGAKLWVVALITMTADALGLILFLTIRKLFVGIRTAGVFVQSTARRLNIIGWVTFAMAPVGMLSELVATALSSWWADNQSISVRVSIDDTDIYAVVIGLVIMVVSQIMLEAIRIHNENGAFV